MLELLENLLSPYPYIPHGHCYLWQTPLLGLHLAQQRQECLTAGCDEFVSKPFRREEILETLAKYLGVQYCYEAAVTGVATKLMEHQPDPTLDAAALAIMPAEWIAQLQYAAAQSNDAMSLKLIAQIPSEQSSLMEALTKLVETYQFEPLMALTQPTTVQRFSSESPPSARVMG